MKIEITDKFKIIIADEGMMLTTWNEGEDIMDYSFASRVYSPLGYDENVFREITYAESAELLKAQEAEALKRFGI